MTLQVFGTHPTVPLSAAIRAGDFIFLSGQVPSVPTAGWSGRHRNQTRQVLNNIKAALETAGATLSDVVKATIWLTDRMTSPASMRSTAPISTKPSARSCVVSQLMVDACVEIEVIAYKPLPG
ncbi:MAG: RidA family protein [Alphaproteobacteria bacterium]|nr:RidA family protein [Alphaproteobacteria bacterium]